MIQEDEVYKIGRIGRTHGIKGELSFNFTDDVWDRAESEYLFLRVDGILVPFFLEEYRFRSDSTALVKFLHYDSANDVQFMVGCDVFFPHSLTPEADEDAEYTWHTSAGIAVFDNGEFRTGLVGELGGSILTAALAGAVLHQAVLRDHQRQTAVGDDLCRNRLAQIPDLGQSHFKA